MSIYGADVEALRQLGRTLAALSEKCSSSEAAVSAALSTTQWTGPDAQRFRNEWQGVQAVALRSAVQSLAAAAATVVREAAEQEGVSGGAGSAVSGIHAVAAGVAPAATAAPATPMPAPTLSTIGAQGLVQTIEQRHRDYVEQARLDQMPRTLASGSIPLAQKVFDCEFMYERAADEAEQIRPMWEKGDVEGAMRKAMSAHGWLKQADLMAHRSAEYHPDQIHQMEATLDHLRTVRDGSAVFLKTGSEFLLPGPSLAFGMIGNLIDDGGKLAERYAANSDLVDLGADAVSVVGQSAASAAASVAMNIGPESESLAGTLAGLGASVALDEAIGSLGEEQRMAFDRAKVLAYAQARGLSAEQTLGLMPKAEAADPLADIGPDAMAEVIKLSQKFLAQ